MSTDNKPAASGSGKLGLGIAIGCGCSLLMALMLIAVGAAMLYGWASSSVNFKVMTAPPEVVNETCPYLQSDPLTPVPGVEMKENSSIAEPVKPSLPATVVETEQKSSVAEPVE